MLIGFTIGTSFASGLALTGWAALRLLRRDSERRRVEDEGALARTRLTRDRDRLSAVLESMSEGVIAFDGAGRVTHSNPAALVIVGRRSLPTGTPLAAFGDIPRLRSTTVAALRGQISERELDVPGNSPRNVLVRAAPAPEGGCVVVMLDVTELRRAERMQRDFVSNVSHELRTPMAVILANAETLRDGAIDDDVHRVRFVNGIVRHSQRLSNVITDLLDLARLEGGRVPIALAPVRVDDAVQEALDAVRELTDERRQSVSITIADDLCVLADAMALERVLVNLLDNASKYGGAGATIAVLARACPEGVRIEVVDDGPGVPPEHRARLFERFYRVDPARSRDLGGTGLGLAIVKHLVDAMGGDIGVLPDVPRGSRFWLLLPRG